MFARHTTLQIRDGRVDHVLHALRNQAVPALQALPGCGEISILADRNTNRVVFISEWDRQEHAVSVADAKYRLAALERIQPDLDGPLETVLYEVSVKA